MNPIPHIGRAIWRTSYSLEEARQRYANRRQGFRLLAAHFALALFRLLGGI